jgi:hypothetical protein
VAGEQADRVADWIGGRREGRGSPEGFFVAEGIGGGERTAASWSRGHLQGPSGWGGSTWRRGAWGGVETDRGGLERVVDGGSGRPERNGGGSLDTGSPIAGLRAIEGQGASGDLVVVKMRAGGGKRWRPSMRHPRWKWRTAWGHFGDSSQWPARGESAA